MIIRKNFLLICFVVKNMLISPESLHVVCIVTIDQTQSSKPQPQMWNISWNVKTIQRNFDNLSMLSSYVLSFHWPSRAFVPPFFLSKTVRNLLSFVFLLILPSSVFSYLEFSITYLPFSIFFFTFPFLSDFRNLLFYILHILGFTASQWSSGWKKHNAWR